MVVAQTELIGNTSYLGVGRQCEKSQSTMTSIRGAWITGTMPYLGGLEQSSEDQVSWKTENECVLGIFWVWNHSTDAQGCNTLALTKEVRVIYLDLKEYNHVGGNLIIKLFFLNNFHLCTPSLLTHFLNHVRNVINDCLVKKTLIDEWTLKGRVYRLL